MPRAVVFILVMPPPMTIATMVDKDDHPARQSVATSTITTTTTATMTGSMVMISSRLYENCHAQPIRSITQLEQHQWPPAQLYILAYHLYITRWKESYNVRIHDITRRLKTNLTRVNEHEHVLYDLVHNLHIAFIRSFDVWLHIFTAITKHCKMASCTPFLLMVC